MNFRLIHSLKAFIPYLGAMVGMSLSSCCSQKFLSIQTDYLNIEDLASYQVKTPDPCLNHPLIGQRLFVNWSIPKCYLAYDNLHLEVYIRFRNHQEINILVPICKKRGTYCYKLLDKEYLEKRGILSYKVELFGDDILLDEQRHQLWVEMITFEQQKAQELEQEKEEDLLQEEWEQEPWKENEQQPEEEQAKEQENKQESSDQIEDTSDEEKNRPLA